MSSKDVRNIGLRLRDRDKELFEYLSSKGIKPSDLFRLGMTTAMDRLKEISPEEAGELWEKIAKRSIL